MMLMMQRHLNHGAAKTPLPVADSAAATCRCRVRGPHVSVPPRSLRVLPLEPLSRQRVIHGSVRLHALPQQHLTTGTSDKFFRNVADAIAPHAGPVELILSPGRGRGLGLSQPCEQGDLLMVSLPISLVYESDVLEEDAVAPECAVSGDGCVGVQGGVGGAGAGAGAAAGGRVEEEDEDDDEGEEDEGEEGYRRRFKALSDMMQQQRYSPSQAHWLEALAPASTSSGGVRVGASRPLPELCLDHTHLRAAQGVPLPASLLSDPETLQALLQTNTFEAASEDLGLAQAGAREPRQQLLGLWPEHALLNHSCVPSTVSYVHNRALVTRVTRRNIAKGSELFTNYIGDLVMSPLHVRREALEDGWGFTCNCPRCKEEAALDPDVQQLVKDIHEACAEQINEDLIDAIQEEDREALQSIQEQAAAYIEVLGAALAKKKLTERTSVWLQAGLFGLYEALYHCVEAQDCRDLGLTAKLQELAGAIQPGSELHCYWARVHLEAVQEASDAGQLTPAPAAAAAAGGTQGGAAGGRGRAGRGGRGGSAGAARGFGRGGRGAAAAATAPGVAPGVTLESADTACYKAFSSRYGSLSGTVYHQLLAAQKELDMSDDDEDEDEL